MANDDPYLPALGQDWLTPLYDPLQRWVMRDIQFKRQLIRQAQIKPGHRVLDLGCGTGTLTILAKLTYPNSKVVGLDGDPRILAITRAKAAKAGVEIRLDHGMAFQMPYPDNSFDRVLSSLVLHHLTTENKRHALREVLRVLRPGGELHVVDFGKPNTLWTRVISRIMMRFEQVADNIRGALPTMFRQAGFDGVEETGRHTTVFGTLAFYQGRKPG
ncbi:MAG: class I SAM-dependent methyltransferase [Anaerolineales bacterium]